VLLRNRLNRFQEWWSQMQETARIYTQYKNAIDTIRQNEFDDDLIEQALTQLQKIWKANQMGRNFCLVDYGIAEVILSQLGAENKRVVMRTVEAVFALIKNDDCADMCIRYGAVPLLCV